MGAPFPHALGGLPPGDTLAASGAVFDAVRGGNKGRATLGTTPPVLGLVKLGVKQLVGGKNGGAKPLAQKGIGNRLRTNTFLPVVKQNTIPVKVVAARFLDKGVYLSALLRCQPL